LEAPVLPPRVRTLHASPPESTDSGWGRVAEARAGTWLLAFVIAAALAHRLYLAVSTDFPINDGGLFYAFIRAIRDVFPALPAEVAYNGLDIPFAYPPLAFWLGALLTKMGGEPLAIIHLMPIAMNAIYLLLFAVLLRAERRTAVFAAIALLFLCTNQRSFEWLVMGGGLSRSLGSICLLLALLAIGLPRSGERRAVSLSRLTLAGVATGAAILSHLEWGIDAAACVVLSRALGSPNIRDFLRSCIVTGTVALLTILPWLLSVIGAHGMAPFQAASGASPWDVGGYLEHVHWLARASLANLLIPIGIVVLALRRDWFWLLMLVACILLTPRHAPTPASLGLAVAAAQGACWLGERLKRMLSPGPAIATSASVVLLLALVSLNGNFLAKGDVLHPLGRDQRAAMAWIASRHPGEPHLILAGVPWWYDASAEWFPVLAGAPSVNTLQGREWMPGGAYARWFDDDYRMKTSEGCDALLASLDHYQPARFVWAEWRSRCFQPPAFRQVYANRSVTIFEKVSAPRSR
jgi:hypothetical protein